MVKDEICGPKKKKKNFFFTFFPPHSLLSPFLLPLWQNLSVGTKLWGCISHVSASELTVSLPGGLKGFVSASETSDIFANEAAELKRGKSISAEEAESTVSPPLGFITLREFGYSRWILAQPLCEGFGQFLVFKI